MDVESSDYYSWAFFDTLGMMLIGMGLLKLDVLTGAKSNRFYGVMAAVGFGFGLPFSAASAYALYAHRFDPVGVAWVTAAYEPGRLSVAMGYIAVVMLIVRSRMVPRAATGLAQVGRMALTNYLTTTLICTTLFNGYGLGWFGVLRRSQLYFVVAAIWSIQIAVSGAWFRVFRFGPAEWVWRSLTYWKVQRWRRGEGEAVL